MTISNQSVFAIVCRHFIGDVNEEVLIDMANTLAPFAESLTKLHDTEEPHIVAATILHDYRGLSKGDAHFLPRLTK